MLFGAYSINQICDLRFTESNDRREAISNRIQLLHLLRPRTHQAYRIRERYRICGNCRRECSDRQTCDSQRSQVHSVQVLLRWRRLPSVWPVELRRLIGELRALSNERTSRFRTALTSDKVSSTAEWRTRSWSIWGCCEPWPGKSSPVFIPYPRWQKSTTGLLRAGGLLAIAQGLAPSPLSRILPERTHNEASQHVHQLLPEAYS